MSAPDLQEIGREMAAFRMSVPLRNRPKYDVESRDRFNAIGHALHDGDVARADALLRQWDRRAGLLAAVPDCCAAPPCLVRLPGETVREHLNRCIDAKGW